MSDDRFTSQKYSATGETLPYAKDPGERELLGSRGGLKHFRPNPEPASPTGTQFHGRLMTSAIPRPEEKVQ